MKITKKRQLNVRTKKGVFKIELQTWDNEPGYVVRVPVFPEITTEGSSIKEAKKMAKGAIELCIECQEKENEHYPGIKSKRGSPTFVAPRL